MRSTFLFGLSLALVMRAMGANSYWVYPQPSGPPGSMAGNIDLTRGAVSTLVWFSNMTSYNVTLWQQQAGNNGANFAGIVYTADGDGLGTIQFNWLADPMATDITESNVFYLYLGFPIAGSISCHYFNMRATPLSLSNSATSVASIGASSTAPPSSLASTSASATPSSAAITASSSSQGPSATTVGLGVGLGVGKLALLVVAGVLWLTCIKRRRDNPATPAPAYVAHAQHGPPPDWYASQEHGTTHEKHGVPSTTVHHEGIYEVSGRPVSPVEAGAKTPRKVN